MNTLLSILQDWAAAATAPDGFDRYYLFGSSIYEGGTQFIDTRSDIDLIARFSYRADDPVSRLRICTSFRNSKQELEVRLLRDLGRDDAGKPIASVVPITQFEIDNDIHKSKEMHFFLGNTFLDLCNKNRTMQHLSGNKSPHVYAEFGNAIAAIQEVQSYRNQFVGITANGKALVGDWDEEDPIPKELMRLSARLRYFALQLDDQTTWDLNRGLYFLYELAQGWRNEGDEYKALVDWFEVRQGGRGKRSPLTPDNQLLLYEILAHEAMHRITKHYRYFGIVRGFNTGQDLSEDSLKQFLESYFPGRGDTSPVPVAKLLKDLLGLGISIEDLAAGYETCRHVLPPLEAHGVAFGGKPGKPLYDWLLARAVLALTSDKYPEFLEKTYLKGLPWIQDEIKVWRKKVKQ